MRHRLLSLSLTLMSLAACTRAASPPTPEPIPQPIPDPYANLPPVRIDRGVPAASKIMVDSVMGTLSVRQKVGQLIMPWLLGNYAAYTSTEYDTLGNWIDSLQVGGIIISIGPPLEIAAKLNALQRRSQLPLLVAADLEWGSGMRLVGGTAFPPPMAVGATGNALDAYELGRITALEARAVGIHMTFSPVADVNNNPNNPVINTRSFGEDPHRVAALIAAYVRGAREHGLFTTAKHFPGHGDTDVDSHISLPVVRGCWNRLDTLELAPFRSAIDAGVTAVMTAHVAVPCLTADSTEPATMSATVMHDVLRDSLGFKGLVVTDALDMGAIVREYGPGESAVQAFLAGSDLLLMPTDQRAALDAMVAAVADGRISMERLDASVHRVLTLKAQAGLFQGRTVPLDSVPVTVATRAFEDEADDVAARSLTLVRDDGLDDIRQERGRTGLIVYANESNLSAGNRLARQLREAGETVSMFRLYPSSGTLSYDSARAVIDRSPRIVFATNVRVVTGSGHIAMPDSLAALIVQTDAAKPRVLVSFGNPYLLAQVPDYQGAYLLAWSDVPATEQAVGRALTGFASITGRLPVTLSDAYPLGFGIDAPKLVADEEQEGAGGGGDARSTEIQFDQDRLAAADHFLASKIAGGVAPGGVLLVSLRDSIALLSTYGMYGVDDSTPVADTTVYDLASLTKVIGLTTATMMLVADGKLDLDRPVQAYLPEFTGPGKDAVRVRHLLLHTSGLPAWAPLYLMTETPDEAVQQVMTIDLERAPGERYEYSDLGAITLGKIVERITGESLDRFLARRLFEPLGMRHTRYLPPESWRPFIAPTERDPWRGRTIRGEVHDENAARLGGVSGHAGLFSNAPDLARFANWLLDAWHDRLPPDAPVKLPAAVVRNFTTKQPGPEGSTRALGWDTPSLSGTGSSGSMLSPSSFGHTGFTGTSIWIDPVRELVIILLTNRVNPTRDNTALLPLRGQVADSVVSALRAGG